jgi:putative glutathione S-transferase
VNEAPFTVRAGERGADGSFRRRDAAFRALLAAEALRAEPGRYHLYVSLACPWCHRTVIVRELMGLTEAVPIAYTHPFRDERGWAFTGGRFDDGPGGEYVDRVNGWAFAEQAYRATDPGYADRVTLPVLWDTATGRIVNNESSEIIRMFAGEALRPPALVGEIDAVNERVYDTVNNGVYQAGFSRSQQSYGAAVAELFASLEWMDGLLGTRRYLAGEVITEADWRAFPTLVRFDEVYHLHFRCNVRRISEFPSLWGYTRDLYQVPGVAATVAMDQIKVHYYTTHDELNPKRIIPVGPAPDFLAAHGRG